MEKKERILSRNNLLGLVLIVTLLFQFIFTRQAWLPLTFFYPKVGLIPQLDVIPSSMVPLLFYGALTFLLAMMVERIRKMACVIFLVGLLLLILDDVNRLQPWLIMNALLLTLWVFKKDNLFFLIKLFLVALYFWSGFNKLNMSFAWEVFPYFMKAFGLNEQFYLSPEDLGSVAMPTINHLAWLVPFTEIAIALLLCFKKSTKMAIVVGIVLHLFIILILGPFGLNWNSVVWIWNLEFILLLLFYWQEKESVRFVYEWKKKTVKLYVFFVALAPTLWYVNLWPHNFSYHLYSGYNPNIRFYFEGINMKILESDFDEFTFFDVDRQQSYILLDYYLMDKINVPVFAEEYYFKHTAKALCECYGYDDKDAGLRVMAKEKFTGRQLVRDFHCSVLISGK